MVQKVIGIGRTCVDVVFGTDVLPGQPVACAGGDILNGCAMLASGGMDVTFVSEAARDFAGDMAVGFLERKGVRTYCVDRYADGGVTAVNFVKEGDGGGVIPLRCYPERQLFNATWPRIDGGDYVIFGGYFALDGRSRGQVTELVQYARERGATVIYLPGFDVEEEPRITRIMPMLLDNLELADVVLCSEDDLCRLFGRETAEECYMNHVRFYCGTTVCVNRERSKVTVMKGDGRGESAMPEVLGRNMQPRLAAPLAGLVGFLAAGAYGPAALGKSGGDVLESMAAEVAKPRLL